MTFRQSLASAKGRTRRQLLAAGALLVLGACRREPTVSESDTTQAAGQLIAVRNTTVKQAVIAIAAARCAREERCENVGPGKKYASQRECSSALEAEQLEDLNGEECLAGIIDRELRECLEEIETQDCTDPLAAVGQVVACRSSDLCRTLPR